MFVFTACFLIAILYWLQFIVFKSDNEKLSSNNALRKLQYQYFAVYFPAVFADWLQGPYLYKLYSSYGFREDEIFFLYVVGFASSFTFGTCICSLADYFGRKKMCIFFNAIYLLSCLLKLSTKFEILLAGRILGGIGTSILFTVFEAWYIYQHVERHQFPVSWMNTTFSKTTFYNGLLAIMSGLLSNIFVEVLGMGPVIPFLLAVPCLMISGCIATLTWNETDTLRRVHCFEIQKIFKILFKKEVLSLCFIQSVFESVMYVFIILWTPVLSSVDPPLGLVFSCFMMCIMIGSILQKRFVARKYEPNSILTTAMVLASVALGVCAIAGVFCFQSYPYLCFLAFLFYEVAVGLYFSVIGFIRSCLIPECYRACLTSWFRLPINFIMCCNLFYFRQSRYVQKTNSIKFACSSNSNKLIANVNVFAVCALALLGAGGMSRNVHVRFDHRDVVQNVYEY